MTLRFECIVSQCIMCAQEFPNHAIRNDNEIERKRQELFLRELLREQRNVGKCFGRFCQVRYSCNFIIYLVKSPANLLE